MRLIDRRQRAARRCAAADSAWIGLVGDRGIFGVWDHSPTRSERIAGYRDYMGEQRPYADMQRRGWIEKHTLLTPNNRITGTGSD